MTWGILAMLPKNEMACYDRILEMLSETNTNKLKTRSYEPK